MSSFQCSDLHISTIATWHRDQAFTGWERKPESPEQIADLALRMYDMNAKAVGTRYAHRDDLQPVTRTADEFLKLKEPPKPDIVQLIKLIDCYLYQCSESDEIEHSPLYKMLAGSRHAISTHYMGEAYQQSAWTI